MKEVHDLYIISKIKPIGKPRMTQSDKWRKVPRTCVQQWYDFKAALLAEALENGYRPGLMDVFSIHVDAAFQVSPSWSKKKKNEMAGNGHRSKPDADNILKAVCDALLDDDSGVYQKQVTKYWTHRPAEICIAIYYYDKE